MQEHYSPSRSIKRLTPAQIRQMKANMRKVPEIQKKSDSYHACEASAAELMLETHLKKGGEKARFHKKAAPQRDASATPLSLWQKIKKYLFG